jgi:3-deoxy-D-manno-octulosonic acid kinase
MQVASESWFTAILCHRRGSRSAIVSEKAIQAQILNEGERIVIYDAARLAPPPRDWFVPDFWSNRSVLAAGRGATFAVDGDFGAAVLRHYRRGGAVARVLKDRYVWTGTAQARPIREFRLLAAAFQARLPVPRPLAAQVQRHSAWYSGDLLMQKVDDSEPLSQRLSALADWDQVDWAAIGAVLGRCHALGFEHADLNAHNILLDKEGGIWLIDWDRGRQRPPGDWSAQVLARLRRSLHKLFGARADADDARAAWRGLLEAHALGAVASAHG